MSPEPIKEPYFKYYMSLVKVEDLFAALNDSLEEQVSFFRGISSDQADHRYAPDKWSIKEILQHLIDTERIFVYRALTFLREPGVELPGYDHENYVKNCPLDQVSFDELIEEFRQLRCSSLSFYCNADKELLNNVGIANGNEMSVDDIGRILVGHAKHHIAMISERYL